MVVMLSHEDGVEEKENPDDGGGVERVTRLFTIQVGLSSFLSSLEGRSRFLGGNDDDDDGMMVSTGCSEGLRLRVKIFILLRKARQGGEQVAMSRLRSSSSSLSMSISTPIMHLL